MMRLIYLYLLGFIPVVILLGLNQTDFAYIFLMISYLMPLWIIFLFFNAVNSKEWYFENLKEHSWFYRVFTSIQFVFYVLIPIFASFYGYYLAFLYYLNYK